MIVDILLYICGLIMIPFSLLPDWIIWPDSVFNTINYVVQVIMKLNFILPIDTILTAGNFVINFAVYYLTIRISIMLISFLRGSGQLKV